MKYLEIVLTVLFMWPAWIIDRLPFRTNMSLEQLITFSFWFSCWVYGAILIRYLFF